MAAVAPIPYSPATMENPQENRSCGGCHKAVEVGTGSIVVAFGNSLWHVDCFKCAKCGERVSADTSLLLLSDGSPVCASCTYNCAVCKNPISDEAIMTGDESYHAACFTCKTCGRHIGELVFAKTTQGIYCMACHNERVARSRRHAEQRRNRSKSRRDNHRDKDREKLQENPSYTQLRDNSSTTIDPLSPPNTPGIHNLEITNANAAVSYSAKRISTQSVVATYQHPHPLQKTQDLPPLPISPNPTHPLPSPAITTTNAPLHPSFQSSHNPKLAPTTRGDAQLLPRSSSTRRKSFDDGVRPVNGLLSPEAVSSLSRAPSSSRRKNGADKRPTPAVNLDWTADKALVDVKVQPMPATSSPTRDGLENGPPVKELRETVAHPASSRKGSLSGSSHSLPSSPSFLNTSHPQPSTENLTAPSKEPTRTMTRALQDQTQLPTPQKPQAMSGRTSPPLPLNNETVSDASGASAHPQTETHDRALPQLPPEAVDYRLSQEGKSGEGAPLALPPISLSESDTNFKDLLELGGGQSTLSTTPPTVLQISREDDARTYTRNENSEAGPSKIRSPVTTTSPSKTISSSHATATSSSPLQVPLNNPPKRSASLVRKFSARKPVPKAIVLPGSFQADMTLEIEDPSNVVSSPMVVGQPETPRKVLNHAANPARRPASAGTGAHPPTSPKVRRSSDNARPGSPLATMATPLRSASTPVVKVTDPALTSTTQSALGKPEMGELILKRIKETLSDVQESGASTVRLDREFLEAIYLAVQTGQEKLQEIRGKFDRMRRTSQQFIEGLSVAQDEYDKELAARRDAEAEVTRLRVQLSGQAARLTQLSAEDRKREIGEQMSRDMSANLDGLERDLSRIMAERDLAVAEVEELTASKITANHGEGALQRSLSLRFDDLKSKYKRELEPLVRQRETLLREINELKEERNICLEETTALNARNEELAELNAQTSRQIEAGGNPGAMRTWSSMPASMGAQPQQHHGPSTPKMTPLPPLPPAYSAYNSTTPFPMSPEDRDEPKSTPNEKKLKWFKPRDPMKLTNDTHVFPPEKEALKHNFQLLTVLRVERCDHCGDKMWGTQLRCNICNLGCHNRCVSHINVMCSSDSRPREDVVNLTPLQPSMFGRDLIEQVRADSVREHRDIPIIVEKCIQAVEVLAMDYEGVYRKTGGTAQSKAITQLFERGNYATFNLNNTDIFNDISSVTSVLKTYFRQLPNPLLTKALHETFVSAASQRDPRAKAESLMSLVYQLPSEHFHTLRYLMLHLHRVQLRSAENLMNARNLGVVFGPTLMRSSDPNREFADMAGKALAVEWLIENAPSVFREDN